MNTDNLARLLQLLTDPACRVSSACYPASLEGLESPGLYAWWIDAEGAAALSSGFGRAVEAGLIYAGQAGAGMSSRSLAQRIRNHRRGNIRGSTFRWTLAAGLQQTLEIRTIARRKLAENCESRLCDWIDEHLSIAILPLLDRGALLVAEAQILAALDPPLNLDGMVSTPLRERLSKLRADLGRVTVQQVSVLPDASSNNREPPASRPVAVGDRIDAVLLLAGLIGRTILTLSGRPNRVLALNAEYVTVATGKSPTGKQVPVAWVQTALDSLVRDRAVEVNVENVGYRSAFIGAVLATVPGTKIDLRPRRVYL